MLLNILEVSLSNLELEVFLQINTYPLGFLLRFSLNDSLKHYFRMYYCWNLEILLYVGMMKTG